jgi:enoyl-CoA hydratase/carnithine racemase
MATGQSLVLYSVHSGVALLQLNAPPANTYSPDLMRALDEAILGARLDESVHAIVIRGAGDKFFCAGADIGMLSKTTPRGKYYFCLHANETMTRLEQTPKLVIAGLNGHAVGGGLEIAMACDLRVAKQGGGKIGLPEVNLGVLPGSGGTQRLARLIGKSRAIEWMAEGNLHAFEEALNIGLINKILPAEGFDAALLEYARAFTPPAKASLAAGLIKRSVTTGSDLSLEAGLALERELQQRLFESEDAREGLAAYTEKRKPIFKGR